MKTADATFKLCIFGDGGVGKTSLTKRYLTNSFDIDTKMTLGASIFVNYIEIEDKRIALQIWDFGGEEDFRFLLPAYAQGTSAGILMFDLTRLITYNILEEFVNFFRDGLSVDRKDIPIFLVGGKMDLADKRSIERKEALQVVEKFNLYTYIECSAKTGKNVPELFDQVASVVLERQKKLTK
jgi:small GTP-binding protein